MPPKKKVRVATESPLLSFLEQTPLKSNKPALDVFGESLADLSSKLAAIIMSDILQDQDLPLLKADISHVFKNMKDDDLTLSLRKQWHEALACEKFLQPEQLTVDMIRDHLLASAFEIIVCGWEDPSRVARLASALGAQEVPSTGEDVNPVIEGILDALVPPDEFLLRTRNRLLTEAGFSPPDVVPRTYSKDVKEEEKDDSGASPRGGTKRIAKGPAKEPDEESDEEAAAGSKKSSAARKRKRGDDDEDEDGKGSEEGRREADSDSSESEKGDEDDPMMTDDKKTLMRRTVDELRAYVEGKLKRELPKKVVKAQLVDIIMDHREKKAE
eukprot:TRINITY_DN3836_c0_g1_i1.p1 TRINITY_DN3836_c0_g1~~TRINITY_DN3836_c0_g1_i1.p1  ORF type:complete len:328 (-),score=60.00 TRINITY_DN3836_c0_g1_i1:613-1596(-)